MIPYPMSASISRSVSGLFPNYTYLSTETRLLTGGRLTVGFLAIIVLVSPDMSGLGWGTPHTGRPGARGAEGIPLR